MTFPTYTHILLITNGIVCSWVTSIEHGTITQKQLDRALGDIVRLEDSGFIRHCSIVCKSTDEGWADGLHVPAGDLN